MKTTRISFESDIGEFWREEGDTWKTFGYRDKKNDQSYWVRVCATLSPMPVLDAMVGKEYKNTGAIQWEAPAELCKYDRTVELELVNPDQKTRSPVDNQHVKVWDIANLNCWENRERAGDNFIDSLALRHLFHMTGPKNLDTLTREDYDGLLKQYDAFCKVYSPDKVWLERIVGTVPETQRTP